jgi:hypothetical protein
MVKEIEAQSSAEKVRRSRDEQMEFMVKHQINAGGGRRRYSAHLAVFARSRPCVETECDGIPTNTEAILVISFLRASKTFLLKHWKF